MCDKEFIEMNKPQILRLCNEFGFVRQAQF